MVLLVQGPCRLIRLTPSWRLGQSNVFQLSRSFATGRLSLAKGSPTRTKTTPTKGNVPAVKPSKSIPARGSAPLKPAQAPSITKAPTSSRHAGRPTPELATTSAATIAKETSIPNAKESPAPLSRTTEKLVYPERLLIFHAGTGRTIFLSCTKLSGIFLVIFTGLFIAPAYYFSPLEPTYLAFVYMAGSCIPLALMTFTAAPFVTYVHLAVPAWARHSAARLQRYAQNLPSTAELDVTSLKWIWPRVTRLNASELYLHQGKLTGAMTLRREVPRHVQESRKWYAWRPIKKFYVGGKAGKKSAEPWVWDGVMGSIIRGFPKAKVERRPAGGV
ncbi:hypothetical protein FH972_021154 [Carpinus fangiana]|uniref:Uncharacterized protein n=1 Tax=Carpinus fangiana TaxID=176857 RepID=A0A5N6KNW4_9ROSI|nr:hypothetical protein FH972_021154 [Carpinus fangiana]